MTEPKVHDLTQNPGILPLKLGIAKNKIDTWSFIQIFDISDTINEFEKLQSEYKKLHFTVRQANTTYLNEFGNSLILGTALEQKITSQLNQINPTLNKRTKRGLINGLGTIFKSITGNLDQDDAERYDQMIQSLMTNQDKLKTITLNQASLLQKSIDTFQNNTKKLWRNEQELALKVKLIENIIKQEKAYVYNVEQMFLIHVTATQFAQAFQRIYDILERLEIAITFAKLNTFHNSMVEPTDLLSEIVNIRKIIESNYRLPFEPKLENILSFEGVLEIKSYNKNNQIIFIIEVPLVEPITYNYYHIYPLPTPRIQTFKMIIPHSKYLLLHDTTYLRFEQPCKEVGKESYLCQETNQETIHEESPCEVHMLRFSKEALTCQPFEVSINNTKIQKVEENRWIVIVPRRKVATQVCGIQEDKFPLQGTYLIELPSQCSIIIENLKLKTYKNPTIEFNPIRIPELNIEVKSEEDDRNHIELKPLQLDSINLDEINNLKSALEIQKIQIKSLPKNIFIPQSTSYISILILIIIVILITLFICLSKKFKLFNLIQKCIKPKKKENPKKEIYLEEIPERMSRQSNPVISL